MNYAVKFYADDDNPYGIPDAWPSRKQPIGEATELPPEYPSEDGWVVMDDADYAAHLATHQADYVAWQVAQATSPAAIQAVIKKRILGAIEFGINLMAEFGAENVYEGRTTEEIIQIAQKLQNVQPLISSGSLYATLAAIDTIEPDALVTQEKLDKYKLKIQQFLGIA